MSAGPEATCIAEHRENRHHGLWAAAALSGSLAPAESESRLAGRKGVWRCSWRLILAKGGQAVRTVPRPCTNMPIAFDEPKMWAEASQRA